LCSDTSATLTFSSSPSRPTLQYLNRAVPNCALAIIDLAEIQDLTLDDPAATHAAALNHAPAAM